MTRSSIRNRLVAVAVGFAGLLWCGALLGCDDYVEAGDFYTPTVEPMDFSPYGY